MDVPDGATPVNLWRSRQPPGRQEEKNNQQIEERTTLPIIFTISDGLSDCESDQASVQMDIPQVNNFVY